MSQVRMFINEQPDIPYRALNYVVADVNYGGRVTDAKDKILISSMLSKYFTPEIQNDNYKLIKIGNILRSSRIINRRCVEIYFFVAT